ncbi:Carbohydrate kinase, FGGY [Coriobacterium glomerans PW2]|uniref:Carbohydrate kinase, FGGY n=1 Tax=Coriobacterium glomerans (strain ATCC 49209 / DSM 20642 / JCM 10262 / PW2) TaxID=700015 RepID=F2NBU9_CORGP|nr:FGGY-family carbohydrate kinase [Coriobacterium glomerans]AEB06908.1 Carbohydrate kinase, FGGY [Coriobacterium glomerans PW2]
MSDLIMACDVGTTGIKTCIYDVSASGIELVASKMAGYALNIEKGGAAEQDPDELWEAMCATSSAVMAQSGLASDEIHGISLCSQMQALVLVDRQGNPVRPMMSYMDQRATREIEHGLGRGPKIAGMNAIKLARSLAITGAVPASVKDPVWKYLWVKAHEPHVFGQVFKWLDIKEYLILRCTGRFVMTRDSAFGTLLLDTRSHKAGFSPTMCTMFGVDIHHLPRIIDGTDNVGPLIDRAARALGLAEGTPVFGGGGDASLIGVGAGAAAVGSTHIYSGTSGWVSTVVEKRRVDLSSMIASVVGASPTTYNYFAELETAGKCLEWVKDHLALDEINIYLKKTPVNESLEAITTNLYDFMLSETRDVPPGSGGVIFTPWLEGNRCPFEDPSASGMFFNIRLETGKRDLIHAVMEGICYHLRWQLEAQRRHVRTSPVVRFVGGGALAPITCQMLANVLGVDVETVKDPQNVGAFGAAVLAGVGLKIFSSVEDACGLIDAVGVYRSDPAVKHVYDRSFRVFRELYKTNRQAFRILNGGS